VSRISAALLNYMKRCFLPKGNCSNPAWDEAIWTEGQAALRVAGDPEGKLTVAPFLRERSLSGSLYSQATMDERLVAAGVQT
jgi:hypothetical protein